MEELSLDEFTKYMQVCEDSVNHRLLSDWQLGFIADIYAKLENYGINCQLSQKQKAKLDEIERIIYQ